MNNQFDELTKGLAQCITRKQALKKFGSALAGIGLAALGLTSKAQAAARPRGKGSCDHCNPTTNYGCSFADPDFALCYSRCQQRCGDVV